MIVLEEFNHEFKPDNNHSQILFEIASPSKTFEEAKKIIEELEVHIIETKYISSNWILVMLDVPDMRNIALKLMENGFLRIKGYNASVVNVDRPHCGKQEIRIPRRA